MHTVYLYHLLKIHVDFLHDWFIFFNLALEINICKNNEKYHEMKLEARKGVRQKFSTVCLFDAVDYVKKVFIG